MSSFRRTFKAAARGLSTLSLVGCGLSLCIHLLSLAGFYSKFVFNFQMALFFGVFPIGLVVVLAQESLLWNVSQYDRAFRPHKMIAAVFAGCPSWLKNGSYGLGAYAIALFVFLGALSNMDDKLNELRLFSAYPAAFYAAFAGILISYANTERSLSPDEIEV
jgi:hypothetical protein